MKGRPRIPAAIKELQNGHNPIQPEPEFPQNKNNGLSSAPTWLKNKEARKVWESVAPLLAGARVLTQADLMALARYCELFAQWIDCKDFINKNGMTYKVFRQMRVTDIVDNGNGGKEAIQRFEKIEAGTREYVEAKNFKTLSKELLSIEVNFGLTPASRGKVAMVDPGKKDPAFDDSDLE